MNQREAHFSVSMPHDESPGGGDRRDVRRVEGRYANHLSVGHNAFEFVLDFGQCYSDGGQARAHTRIIVSPNYVKAFSEILCESIAQYEGAFGLLPGVAPGPGASDGGTGGDGGS